MAVTPWPVTQWEPNTASNCPSTTPTPVQWHPPPPTSHDDSLDGSLASVCASTTKFRSHDGSLMLRHPAPTSQGRGMDKWAQTTQVGPRGKFFCSFYLYITTTKQCFFSYIDYDRDERCCVMQHQSQGGGIDKWAQMMARVWAQSLRYVFLFVLFIYNN